MACEEIGSHTFLKTIVYATNAKTTKTLIQPSFYVYRTKVKTNLSTSLNKDLILNFRHLSTVNFKSRIEPEKKYFGRICEIGSRRLSQI